MSGTTRRITIAKAVWVLLAVSALAAFAGCSGQTTGASDITRQPDGTYSAKLNAIGSCDHGSPSTPCTAYTRWRKVGTSAWTNGPAVTVPRVVKDIQQSQTASGLAPKTQYEYQVCGNESGDHVVCVGPSPTDTKATEKFGTVGQTTNQAGGKKGQSATSQPGSGTAAANGAPQASSSSGGGGGTSPLVPIAIGVGAGALVLGGTWWASRRFHW